MERIQCHPRDDWRQRVEDCGLIWHSAGRAPYWNEEACYGFTTADIRTLQNATAELYRLFVAAGEYIIDQKLLARFGIPAWCHDLIRQSWLQETPALNYGRFDLGFDGREPPKLFEFNADTPTALLEASIVQRQWRDDLYPDSDQFNALHEMLVAKWTDIAPGLAHDLVHFAHARESTGEEAVTCAYLRDTAHEAGLRTKGLFMADIGWAHDARGQGRFYDLDNDEIATLYKLYPWEWLVDEPFGRNIADNAGLTLWVEPIWKMIWSHKAILAILWDLFPRHPNLLWARLQTPIQDSYVKKPCLGREGANTQVMKFGSVAEYRDGPYAEGPFLYQGLYDLPDFAGNRPVIGSWIVDGEPAGIGVREDGLITSNLARFVPHVIV